MNSIRYSRRQRKTAELNMAPLMDMIFILLIFFIVTTSFVKEAGVDVERPRAKTTVTKEKTNMVIAITSDDLIYIEGRTVDILSVRARMERFLAEVPDGAVVIAADRNSHNGAVIGTLDACRMAGVKNISVAARKSQ